jgi:lysophospholipase L1-like esterase
VSRRIRLLVLTSFLLGCSEFPYIEVLVPSLGSAGDVIDIRDPGRASLDLSGVVHFGQSLFPQVLLWTPEDVYFQVPPGVTGSVSVMVSVGGLTSNIRYFTILEDTLLRRIMFFGDSLIHWGITPLAQTLIREDPDLNALDLIVLNQGRGGERLTGAGTLARWTNAIDYSGHELAFLLEGTIDVTDTSRVSLAQMEEALIRLVEEAQGRDHLGPILCTLLPRPGSCGDMESPTVLEYNDWLRSYADGTGLAVVDLHSAFLSAPDWDTLYFDAEKDCVHPNPAGRQRMAELMTDRIREVYLPTF